ncbi:MAG TPA: ATP-binding protein [Lacipirellulaceae bacterium]|nr:ATP-binding protein [Lacipirellulaceae bacterium]
MFRRGAKLGLSRKIVAYYLFFCLVAVCWLAAGAVAMSRAVVAGRSAEICLTRIGGAASAIKMQLLRGGPESCHELLADLRRECQAQWCGIVGAEGKFLAHTSPERIGQVADQMPGDRALGGPVTRVDYAAADGHPVREYHSPLTSGRRNLGELRFAVGQPGLWATVQAAAPVAPLAIVAPLGVVALGAWLLRTLAQPVAVLEAVLERVGREPFGAPICLQPVRARDAATFGFNRVVEQLADLQRRADASVATRGVEATAPSAHASQFEEVLQRLTDGVAVTDAAGRIEFANQAVAALLGEEAPADALAGTSLEQRLQQFAGNGEGHEPLLAAGAQRRTIVCELTHQAADSERVLRVARLPLGGDSARRFVWSLRDVTQQKLTEQTRDRFIDTATHELRTPLTNIKAYAETLATSDYIDVELQKEFCNIINSEVTRLARFIDDLLSISSMEAGALTIDRQKVETQRMFAEVLAKVEPQMQKKSIEFSVSLAPKMPELHLDKDKIIAVLVNIIGNAAKYTPQGGRVALKVKPDEDGLRIAVEDTGVGIAPDELPKVFEKFFRSDDPRVQAEVGSGLGLSLAREVVRMHGGDVTVESVLDQGSTFTIWLPLT